MSSGYLSTSCKTEDDLLRRIKDIDQKTECANTKRFRDEFIQYGGNATETCVKALFEKDAQK